MTEMGRMPALALPACTNPVTPNGSASVHVPSVNFFDFAGPAIPNGGSANYSVTTQDGRTITATVRLSTPTSGNTLAPVTIDIRPTGVFLNSTSNASSVRESFRTTTTGASSTVTVDFSIGGSPAAIDVVAFDGEASAGGETWRVSTNGGTFETIDSYRNFSLTGEETTSVFFTGSSVTPGFGTPLLLSRNASQLVFTWTNAPGGLTGIGFAVFTPQDTGDAVAAYGDAFNQLDVVNASCTVFAQPGPYLGASSPDTENVANSAGADADDLSSDDEDAFSPLPSVRLSDGSYDLNVPVVNPSGSGATLGVWVDLDRSNSFEADEFRSAAVAAGFSGNVPISYTLGGAGADIVSNGTTYARFRIANDPIGFADFAGLLGRGETEDYAFNASLGLTVAKTLASGPTTGSGANSSIVDAGDTADFSFEITNLGNDTIGPITVSDILPGVVINCPSSGSATIANLAGSNSEICTITYTLQQSDFDTNGGGDGDVDNTATASYDPGSGTVDLSDSAEVSISQISTLSVNKLADATSQAGNVPLGAVITYTFSVTNTGNQNITNISVGDVHGGSGAPPVPDPESAVLTDNTPLGDSSNANSGNGVWDNLAPGDVLTITANYTVTQSDIDNLQ